MAWANPPQADKPRPSGPTLASFLTNDPRQFPSPGEGGPSADGVVPGQPTSKPGYRVKGSKKGGFPVSVEKRSCGKKVTVVRNVSGDRESLLSGLKKKLGCGGIIDKDGNVEVQGERAAAVERFLAEADCLTSVSRANQAAAAPPRKAARAAEPTKIDRKMAAARGAPKGACAVELSSITEQAAKKMKPAEMKAHLKAGGLSTQGNKKELLVRLLEHIKS